MKDFLVKFLVIHSLLSCSGFTQEAIYNPEVTGVTFSGMFSSGEDYRSKGLGVMLLHQGKFFLGYEHDNIEVWINEGNSHYKSKQELSLDGFYIGFRNYEKPEKKQFFSTTIQAGSGFSSAESGIHMIPIAITIFKSFSNSYFKIIPLIYGSYAYVFSSNRTGTRTDVSSETAYGLQFNVAFRPIPRLNHGLAFGLDWNFKNRDVPISFQISLALNAFKVKEK